MLKRHTQKRSKRNWIHINVKTVKVSAIIYCIGHSIGQAFFFLFYFRSLYLAYLAWIQVHLYLYWSMCSFVEMPLLSVLSFKFNRIFRFVINIWIDLDGIDSNVPISFVSLYLTTFWSTSPIVFGESQAHSHRWRKRSRMMIFTWIDLSICILLCRTNTFFIGPFLNDHR